MKILSLEAKNYRNIESISFCFSKNCNFIVGENNIGKSNILNLLKTIFLYRSFSENDFNNIEEKIEANLTLSLSDVEIGIFDDLFDTTEYHNINIRCIQETPDDIISYCHVETDTYLPSSAIKCLNYVYYDSLRNPVNEIQFEKKQGAGLFLSKIINMYLSKNSLNSTDFFNETKLTELAAEINRNLKKLKTFSDYDIGACLNNDIESVLPRLLSLKDENDIFLTQAGYGVQFYILITLSILEKIQLITQSRDQKCIFTDQNQKRFISLVLALDEPEIHMHPYMQRSLVKYLSKIIDNSNIGFNELLKEFFNIDGVFGQLFIITHSPSILLNDYHQIVRLSTESTKLKSISGTSISLTEKEEKMLFLTFPFMKEAFFSRCVVFVEGDSEYSSLAILAEKIGVSFDDHGISVIQTHGGGSGTIANCLSLATKFSIKAIGLTDRDDTQNKSHGNLFVTGKVDFEEELVHLVDCGKEVTLRSIVSQFESDDARVQVNAMVKHLKKYEVLPNRNDLRLNEIASDQIALLKCFYLTWFSINKSYPLGLLIGQNLAVDEIPSIIKDVVHEAHRLAAE